MANQGYDKDEEVRLPHRDAETRREVGRGNGDVSGRRAPPSPAEEKQKVNTPGDGAGPDPARDGDADPGVG